MCIFHFVSFPLVSHEFLQGFFWKLNCRQTADSGSKSGHSKDWSGLDIGNFVKSQNNLFEGLNWLKDSVLQASSLSIFTSFIQPCKWFMEVPSQFSMGQTAQSLTCSIMEKSHTGLDDCLNMLLSCFREKMSGLNRVVVTTAVRLFLRAREDWQTGPPGTCIPCLASELHAAGLLVSLTAYRRVHKFKVILMNSSN